MSPRAKTTTPPTPTEAPTVTPPTATAPAGSAHLALRRPRLPQWAPWLVAAVAAATSAILALLLGWSVVGWAVVAVLVYAVVLPSWSRVVENARAAKDRLVTTLVWSAFAVALVPLVALIWKVLAEGAPGDQQGVPDLLDAQRDRPRRRDLPRHRRHPADHRWPPP